ncbi:hypothetical protein P3342_009089 [Pyrenophora teres f. teres]|nr:hypothetical protein P3342_009089 [Pyrenophora teres f. teres]
MWAKGNISTRSPFIVAAEESSLTALPKVLNAFFIVSAYTTANNDLYGASRSVFMLSQQYLPRRVANIFGRTNNGHTPLAAILLCSALGFLSLIGLADKSGSQPRITLSELYTGTATCINLFLCITFLRFKAGLDRLAKRRIFSRQHPLYRSRLFKSRWQPLPAYIGIVGSACVIAWSGIPPLVILVTKGSINSDSASRTNSNQQPASSLTWSEPTLDRLFRIALSIVQVHFPAHIARRYSQPHRRRLRAGRPI